MPSINLRQLGVAQATGATPTTTSVPEPSAVPGNTAGDAELTIGIGIVCAIVFGTVIVYQLLKQLMLCHQTATWRRNRASRRSNSGAIYNSNAGDLESGGHPPPSYSTVNLLAGAAPAGSTRPHSVASNRSGGGDKIAPPRYSRVALPGTALIANHTQTTSHHVSWTVVESIELTENHTSPGTGNRGRAAGPQVTEQARQATNSRTVWWSLPALSIF